MYHHKTLKENYTYSDFDEESSSYCQSVDYEIYLKTEF